MTEDQLRALVREIVEERLSSRGGGALGLPPSGTGERPHSSHQRLRVEAGAETGGACLIEPAVRCNLCGYCQSLGH